MKTMKFHFRHHDHHSSLGGGVVVPVAKHPSSLLVIDAHADASDHGHGAAGGSSAEYGDEQHHGTYAMDASRHHGVYIHKPPSGISKSPSWCSVSMSDSTSSIASRHFDWVSPRSASASTSSLRVSPPTTSDDDYSASSPVSKRALHLEHHESECPVSNPDPHSRPRSRQFFRLGRHKYKATEKASKGGSGKVSCDEARCGGLCSDSSDDELMQGEHHRNRSRMGIAGLRKPKLRRAQSLPISSNTRTDISSSRVANSPAANGGSNTDDWTNSLKEGPNSFLTIDERLHKSDSAIPFTKAHLRRCVTFTCVQVREYSTILGDHPCCPSGPPLSLGWELKKENSIDFEVFEKEREPLRRTSREQLRLGGEERREILQSLVVSSPITVNADGGDETIANDESNDASAKPAAASQCCVYSQQELRRAERRLTRDRQGLNSRACRRQNRGFFRPLSVAECEIKSGSPGMVTATEEGSPMNYSSSCVANNGTFEEQSRTDISPIKSASSAADAIR